MVATTQAPAPHTNEHRPDETYDVDGFQVRVYGQPDAPAVLLLHGLILDGRMWDGQIEALRQSFRVVVPDFLNHGQSAPAPAGYNILKQADDLNKILDRLEVPDAILVGFSMGGMTAMQFASRSPMRVKALALLNTSAETEPTKAKARFSALALSARLFGLQPWLRRRALEVMFGVTFRATHPDVVAWWDQRLAGSDKRAVQRAVQLVISRPRLRGLEALDLPTLVIASDEDIATPVHRGRHIADTIPNASFQLIPRCGHCSPVEQPELVSSLLLKFCERVSGVA